MAKQSGIIPIEGTLGNITFYRSKDGYVAREKGTLNASRIANDPSFVRTRENGAEFGRAGKAGKVLRTALRSLLLNTADSRMIARLTREMMKVIQADAVNPRGMRNVIDGEAMLLEGFEFNINSKLSTTLFAPFTVTINRSSGVLTVTLPAFIAGNQVAAPGGTTHFKLVSAGMLIDFENAVYEVQQSETASLQLDQQTIPAVNLQHQLSANSTHPLFVALGIQFFQQVNGELYPLKNGAFNSLNLVKVDA